MNITRQNSSQNSLQKQDSIYKWSNQTFTLVDIVDGFQLPCVVQSEQCSCEVNFRDFSFDMTDAFLLHSIRVVKKVSATVVERDINDVHNTNPEITIPFDYDGWFEIRHNEIAIAPYSSVRGLVANNVERFLCMTQTEGMIVKEHAKDKNYQEHFTIEPGSVLRVIENFRISKNRKENKHGVLTCLDEQDNEITLSYNTIGTFYECGCGKQNLRDITRQVFNIKDVLLQKKPPILVKLISGELPKMLTEIKGFLSLNHTFTETTGLASSLSTNECTLFELALDSSLKYHIALNGHAAEAEYKNAMTQCDKSLDNYASRMKVAFTLSAIPTSPSSHYVNLENNALATDV